MAARELNVLIRDANYLFVFLPVVNLAYLYSNAPNIGYLSLSLVACVTCAFALNFTIGAPDPKDETGAIPESAGILFLICVLCWVCLLSYSVYQLYPHIGKNSTTGNILFFVSVSWTILLSTHFLLDWKIDDYSNSLFEFKY